MKNMKENLETTSAVLFDCEIFFPLASPEEKIKNEIINQYIKDNDLENGFIKLCYKIDTETKMYLSVTTGKHKDKTGLYFNVNFHCVKVLSHHNFLEIAKDKIAKLLNLT